MHSKQVIDAAAPIIERNSSEWRSGGAMLFASAIAFCCMALPLTALGVLIKPLSELYGWSRGAIAASVLITATGTLLFAPIVGAIVDRFGPRRVALVGLWLLGAGIAGIGLSGPSLASWYLAWIIYAVLQPTAGNVVWANAVAGRFDKNRGTALAFMLVGLSITSSLVPIIALSIMNAYGWRAVFFCLGGFTVVVAWPLVWLLFYGASDLARRNGQHAQRATKDAIALYGFKLKEIVRRRQFWQLILACTIGATAVSALNIHFLPILSDAGLSPSHAALVALIMGPATLLGRFGSGLLLDHVPAPIVSTIVFMTPGLSHLIMFTYDGSVIMALAAGLTLGMALGAEADLMAYLVSRYFGLRAFSATYGILLGMYSMGYGVAPVFAGILRDISGSYHMMFMVLLLASVIGAVLCAFLGSPPSFSRAPKESGPA